MTVTIVFTMLNLLFYNERDINLFLYFHFTFYSYLLLIFLFDLEVLY